VGPVRSRLRPQMEATDGRLPSHFAIDPPLGRGTHSAGGAGPFPARRGWVRQCRSGWFARGQSYYSHNCHARIVGGRGITSGGQAAPVTLDYLESGHQSPEVAVRMVPHAGSAEPVKASASPTETPQLRDTVADPHRNPTDFTAHSGTLVLPVKARKIPVTSVDAHELGCGNFSRQMLYGVTEAPD
jgi:hypothetical protein